VGVAPQDVVADWRHGRVFVSSAGESPNRLPDAVTAIDTRSHTVATTYDGGWAPVGMAHTPRRRLLLVANFYAGELRVMRARSGRLLRTIPAGAGAAAVAVVRR
jgi:DNA-binding beta-propeller fold protein YncE